MASDPARWLSWGKRVCTWVCDPESGTWEEKPGGGTEALAVCMSCSARRQEALVKHRSLSKNIFTPDTHTQPYVSLLPVCILPSFILNKS